MMPQKVCSPVQVPVAYDVDKVINRLDSSPVLKVSQYPLHGDYLKKEAAINIVRGGGASE